ncbi:hypothetical protein LOTGIDRAFT_236795 [Lottia gigantea]|uniref:Uncharacterized protein n=1 Tax=Lottia gigantea TaxID=225164 RepID=V3ZLE4_LOTGI|nr:hypothetical protein LOTGIDRAFT_236795 [Lottia gigantea]ESO83210.1 hypothetical protein LOTGIDRAFT_236795 [Lottia gigantea]
MEEQKEPPFKESFDSRKLKPPNKKKFEEELERLTNKLKELESQYAGLKSSISSSPLKSIRLEKDATFDRNKKINNDLKSLNKEISEKIYSVSQLQSGLVYKNEDKHNDAIRKLEWNLAHHSYRLTEERRIVAEIDKLKRSKISLNTYNNAKAQLDELRNKQRRMREERDHYSRTITQLRSQEDEAKRKLSANRITAEALKKEIDELYAAKRKLYEDFKRNQAEFQDAQKKKRQESFKKKEEERKAVLEAKQREEEELEELRVPYEQDKLLCNTLISYLQGFPYTPFTPTTPTTPTTPSTDSPTSCSDKLPYSSGASSGPAEELEDGNLILLKKSEDNDFIGGNVKKTQKKRGKSRKPSMTKLITHCPEVITQFASLNLRAPCSVQEIPASLEQLRARKLYYEQISETQSTVSLTESGICEMSRQASNTESCGSACETRPSDHILDEIVGGKDYCPEFPEVESFTQIPELQSMEGSETPRNLSVSSGSVMSTDVEEFDSNGQSLESSGHLSHIDQSEFSLHHKKVTKSLNEVLKIQSETVSQSENKSKLNQPEALLHNSVEKSNCMESGDARPKTLNVKSHEGDIVDSGIVSDITEESNAMSYNENEKLSGTDIPKSGKNSSLAETKEYNEQSETTKL